MTQGDAGFKAQESLDGRTLFFARAETPSPLVALTLAERTERAMSECVSGWGGAFGVATDGLYYVDCSPEAPAVHRLDLASGHDQTLGVLEGFAGFPIAVSPDGQTVLYPRVVSEGSDIMLIENFR